MPKYTFNQDHGVYVDPKGQGILFPELIDERQDLRQRIEAKIGSDKTRAVFDYVDRQARLTPDKDSAEILREMIAIPEGYPDYLHPGNFPGVYAERALRLVAERIRHAMGEREPPEMLYTRLRGKGHEHGLIGYQTPLEHVLETLIHDPSLLRNVDFRADRRMHEDTATRQQFHEALLVRGQEQPNPEDRELHRALNKIPFPNLDREDVEKLAGILGVQPSKPKYSAP